jgi:hypothetical protein
MKRRHRRRRQPSAALLTWLNRIAAGPRAHPLRTGLFGAAALVLAWLTLTKSLPLALAPIHPDWALALNPNSPAALTAKARQIMEPLLIQSRTEQGRSGESTAQRTGNLEKLPEAASDGAMEEPQGERAAMRKQVRQLALRALAADPLSADAYELLAMAADELGEVRVFMQEAAYHSRHKPGPLLWLLGDSFHRRDYAAGLEYGDLLLRTHSELSHLVLGYFVHAAESAEGFPHVVDALAKNPGWRGQFFEVFAREMRQTALPLRLMEELREKGVPPSPKELAPYLDALMRIGQVDTAYNAWLQLMPEERLDDDGLLADGGFENAPGILPFGWKMASGLNAVAEFVGPAANRSGRLFHVSFGVGRVKFPELSQVVILGPGRYRLEGKVRGTVISKRGLRWQLICASGSHRLLAETDMLIGDTQQWRVFALEGDVPAGRDCVGQMVRLMHDSRSPSEEFISGEVWFGGLRLERIVPSSSPPG